MLNTGPNPDYQNRLLSSLEKKIFLDAMPKPSLTPPEMKLVHLSRGGRGSIDDHMRIMSNYICSCGHKTESIDHTTQSNTNGTALDIYKMKCSACGDNEEVSFLSLRSTLQQLSKNDYTKDKTRFPYL